MLPSHPPSLLTQTPSPASLLQQLHRSQHCIFQLNCLHGTDLLRILQGCPISNPENSGPSTGPQRPIWAGSSPPLPSSFLWLSYEPTSQFISPQTPLFFARSTFYHVFFSSSLEQFLLVVSCFVYTTFSWLSKCSSIACLPLPPPHPRGYGLEPNAFIVPSTLKPPQSVHLFVILMLHVYHPLNYGSFSSKILKPLVMIIAPTSENNLCECLSNKQRQLIEHWFSWSYK